MKLDKITDAQCSALFNSIDVDQSGAIEYAELHHDFERCRTKTVEELDYEEGLLHGDFGDKGPAGLEGAGFGASGAGGQMGGVGAFQEAEYQRKVASLEGKLKQAHLEVKNERALKQLTEESLTLVQKHHDDLRKQFEHITEHYYGQQKTIKEHEVRLQQSIPKNRAEEIQRSNTVLQQKLAEARAALLSYKSMHGVVCEQVKSLQVMHERGKDERESLVSALRDLQSESFDKQRFGKLYYVVMLSRWQEAAVNKKYAVKLTENKELAGELLDA